MAKFDRTIVQEPSMERPHLVILGAGATFAAFPNGDKTGKKLPLMYNIVEVCGIQPILDHFGIAYKGNDFEAFFSALVADGKHSDAVTQIENAIANYFASMELPDEPTLYDHLVLSLRPKDVIATFNWDPFLMQAMIRNDRFTPMPMPLFLHGNVAVGYCMRHKPATIGPRDTRCGECGEQREASRLLYPVAQKNYNNDPLIAKSWSQIQGVLRDAYLVTMFGYSAPKTDVEAIALLKNGWGAASQRAQEEIEIIDIKNEDQLFATWEPFIHSHHYQCVNDFYSSLIATHPRRTCDAMFDQFVNAEFIHKNPLPRHASWSELYGWLKPIIDDEQEYERLRTKN